MILTIEDLKRSPLWVIKFIHLDMQKFDQKITDQVNNERIKFLNDVDHVNQIKDFHVQQIVAHLNDTTRCLLNYAYVNSIDIEGLDEGGQDFLQAKTTWGVIIACHNKVSIRNQGLLEQYSSRTYMYCMLLWNCAEQVLQNKVDVFNDTIGKSIYWMTDSEVKDWTLGDERTKPLFQLINQISNFRIIKQ